MSKIQLIVLMLVVGSIPGFAAGQTASVYKWVDEDGITNFGSMPPEWAKAERTTIRIRGTDHAAVAAQSQQNATFGEATEIRKRQEAGDAAEAADERKEVAAQRAENCRVARERLTRYSEAHRLYRPGPDGEREYLSSDEIDSERAEAINSVGKWCDKS